MDPLQRVLISFDRPELPTDNLQLRLIESLNCLNQSRLGTSVHLDSREYLLVLLPAAK